MPGPTLNFDRAQYDGGPIALDHCAFCGRGVTGQFYRTNGDLTCTICAERLRNLLPPDTHKIFWNATAVGAITAAVTSALFFVLFQFMETRGFGMGLGFAAIGAGYLIGKSMQRAAKGAGGRRYQITAALLTYAAVTIATSAAILGTEGVPLWAYPLLALAPLAQMVLGHFQMGAFQLLFAGIAIRWAWMLLRPHRLKITGPETLASGPAHPNDMPPPAQL